MPADGVYAGRLVRANGEPMPAATSIGTNPTFAGTERRVEAFVLDAPAGLDLYGEHVGVEFVERLRPMVAYTGREALITQMDQDVLETRRVLGVP